jgi:hypothetical protein
MLGLTYKEIGDIYNVSNVTAYYWLCGGKRYTGVNRNAEYNTKKTSRCQVCHRHPRKGMYLQHHHWDHNNPEIGIWLCDDCHKMAKLIDKFPDAVDRYKELKIIIYDMTN